MKVFSTIIDPILNLQGTHEEFRASNYMTVASGLPGSERASTLLQPASNARLGSPKVSAQVGNHNSDTDANTKAAASKLPLSHMFERGLYYGV